MKYPIFKQARKEVLNRLAWRRAQTSAGVRAIAAQSIREQVMIHGVLAGEDARAVLGELESTE